VGKRDASEDPAVVVKRTAGEGVVPLTIWHWLTVTKVSRKHFLLTSIHHEVQLNYSCI